MKSGNPVVKAVRKVFMFYYDGFRSMTVGKTLWVIILLKLFVLFFIMRLFFFPDILKRDYSTDEERSHAVFENLTGGNDKN